MDSECFQSCWQDQSWWRQLTVHEHEFFPSSTVMSAQLGDLGGRLCFQRCAPRCDVPTSSRKCEQKCPTSSPAFKTLHTNSSPVFPSYGPAPTVKLQMKTTSHNRGGSSLGFLSDHVEQRSPPTYSGPLHEGGIKFCILCHYIMRSLCQGEKPNFWNKAPNVYCIQPAASTLHQTKQKRKQSRCPELAALGSSSHLLQHNILTRYFQYPTCTGEKTETQRGETTCSVYPIGTNKVGI